MNRNRQPSTDQPSFDAPLLGDIAVAFLRRRKAIRYNGGLKCAREFTETGAGAIERLDLETGPVRLNVWADGALSLSVRVRGAGRNAGWSFADQFHGEVNDVSATAVVRMVEATLRISFGTDQLAEREQLRRLWAEVRPR